jgi:hypothetical protein
VAAPTDPNRTPPGHYLLFILDGNGVPSVAKIVRVTEASQGPTVTLTVTDATATEAGLSPGQFTVTRTGAVTDPLTVLYTVGGTATAGADYQTLPGSVTLPAGQASAPIVVTPVDDATAEPDETVVVTLSTNAAYIVGSPASGAVTIVSDEIPPASEIIIDNGQPGTSFTGVWSPSSAPNRYGGTALYSNGAGVDTYRWTPTIPAGGATYDVYVWWTSDSDRALNVPYTIVHAGGTFTTTRNQRVGGGQWQYLGTFAFNAGTGGSVEVSDVNGRALADAARFVPQ